MNITPQPSTKQLFNKNFNIMDYLGDISNFSETNDYLSILNACFHADLFIIFLVYHNFFKSEFLKQWYKRFQFSAVLADVLIVFIVIIAARFIYTYYMNSAFSLWKFTGISILIQFIHDFIFSSFISIIPKGYNAMFDFFKDYINEVGVNALLGDTFMIIMVCILSSHFVTYTLNTNLVVLIITLYSYPFCINYL